MRRRELQVRAHLGAKRDAVESASAGGLALPSSIFARTLPYPVESAIVGGLHPEW